MRRPRGIPWHLLRAEHRTAIRVQLLAVYATYTSRKTLSALSGVLRQCWRLQLMNRDDYERTTDWGTVRRHHAHRRRRRPAGTSPDDLQFTSVERQVGGLTELSGVQPFKDPVLPQPDALQADFVASAAWSAEAASQTWTAENGDHISLRYVPTWPNLGGFGYTVRTSPVVSIKDTPRGIDSWMNDYVRPLAQLTALGTCRVQPVSWVMACAGDRGPGAQVFASDVAQDPFDADLYAGLRLGTG